MLHIISCPRLAIIQTQSYKNRENTGNKESKTSLSEKYKYIKGNDSSALWIPLYLVFLLKWL